VPRAGRLGLVKELGDPGCVTDAQHRGDQVDPVRPGEGIRIGGRVVPVEEHVAAVTRRSTGGDAVPGEVPGDKRACPAAAAEDERCVGCVGHGLSIQPS
jgi:hypothetical protein